MTRRAKTLDTLPAVENIGSGAAFTRARLLARCTAALGDGATTLFVPGRIELLGKHTDYAGGRSLLCAVDRGIGFAMKPRADHKITVLDVGRGESIEFDLSPQLQPRAGHWSNYPMTVGRRLSRNFSGNLLSAGNLLGGDIAMLSDLPPSAGLSSSSAIIVGIFLLLARVNRLVDRKEYQAEIHSSADLSAYLGAIENGRDFGSLLGDAGVGTQGGSQDHTAILLAKPGRISMYSFCPVRFEGEVAAPAGYSFVIATSGVIAEKTGSAKDAYNAVSYRVTAILERWNAHTGRQDLCLADALRSSPDAIAKLRSLLTDPQHVRRLDQFHLESERWVPAAFAALSAGELNTFGQIVAESQHAAETLLHNQIPETIALARAGRECGAAAVSCFGAGFGGSAWAMVPTIEAETFANSWLKKYRAAVGNTAVEPITFITTTAAGATFP